MRTGWAMSFERLYVKTNRWWKRDQEKQLKPEQSNNRSIHFESYEMFHWDSQAWTEQKCGNANSAISILTAMLNRSCGS